MSSDQLRGQLERSIRAIVDAVGGAGACLQIGYIAMDVRAGDGEHRSATEHRFFVIVESSVKGAILGRRGINAERLRELVRTRAAVLKTRDVVDIRVISEEGEAPVGAFS